VARSDLFFAGIIVVVVAFMGIVSVTSETNVQILLNSSNTFSSSVSQTLSSNSALSSTSLSKGTANNSSSTAYSFEGFPELSVWQSECGALYPNGDSFCSPASLVETPVQVNLTTSIVRQGNASVIISEQYIGIEAGPGALLQYTFSANGGAPQFQAYFDNRTGASVLSMQKEIEDYRPPLLANESLSQVYRGQVIPSQSGLLIFSFSVSGSPYQSTISFLLRNATDLQDGIRVSIGSPVIRIENMMINGSGTTFPGLEEWPLKIFANSTANVDLATPGFPSDVWAKMVPSHLSVGPGGADATLLLAGAVGPGGFSNGTQDAISLFIDARGSNGLTGEKILPILIIGGVNILHSPGSISLSGIVTSGSGQAVTGYDYSGVVYDPAPGLTANQSIAVSLSVRGIRQNGTVSPLPASIRVLIPQASFTLDASQPFYFQIGATVPGVAEGGVPTQYVIVLNENVGGENFSADLVVNVFPPVVLSGI
jgi:hypothetical protein